MRPIIGITPASLWDEQPYGTFLRFATASTYVNAVLAAGGLPIVLPPQDGDVGRLLEIVDGLLLSGGGDVEPARYGDETVHPQTYGVDHVRDRFELALLEEALRRDTPVFCICRGIQVLNVALGGTLHQHVPDQPGASAAHLQHEAGIAKEEIGHLVIPQPGGPIERLYGSAPVGVNSFHHQAIRTLGSGLEVAAISEDGLIESVALAGKAFVLGVQWHPEMMFERHPEQLAPFAALVEEALARRLAGGHI